MRDLVLLLALIGCAGWALYRPWVGAVASAFVSLSSPHIQFGYAAASWPVATVLAVCTLIGLAVTKDRWNPFVGAPVWWLLAFTVWICITLPNSFFFDDSYPLWERSMKIYLLIFVTLSLINTRLKLQAFVWAIVLAIGYYGFKGGIFTVITGGNYRVWGSGGFIEGNNEVALAVITTIPLMRYLQQQMTDKRARLAMTVLMLLSMIMAMGTQSRGALLGLMTMGAMLWWKGSNKLIWAVLIVIIAIVGVSFMPDKYWDRMETIRTFNEDSSAMGRINAWWVCWYVARDHVFGGGFMMYELPVFQRYAPVPDDVHAAHSIYFQVMGEHGFIGLFIFLMIGAATWLTARKLVKLGRQDGAPSWALDLGRMIPVSMIGYATTGAFLSMAYFDLPYYVMVIAVCGLRVARAEQLAPAPVPAAATAAMAPEPGGPQHARR